MKLAILGTRGIPARYGGFETFAEELSRRLAARGHQVTVYCRSRYPEAFYHGVRLRYLPTIRHKYLDTVVHTFLSTLDLLIRRQDVALYCNAANALFTFLPRLLGIPVALNVDGLERKRRKWSWLGRSYPRLLPPAVWQGFYLHPLRRRSRQGALGRHPARARIATAALFPLRESLRAGKQCPHGSAGV